MNLRVRPVSGLRGAIDLPGDKSITHRALLLGSLSAGASRIRGYLDSGDCRATMGCLRALGVPVEQEAEDTLTVRGAGLRGWREPENVLNCVRSGTTMRLMAGLLAGQPFYSVLGGEAQLLRRPMDRVAQPLRLMGAQITGRQSGKLPPLTLVGAPLHGIEYTLPVASAQVKSCLLLAGLYAEGMTTLIEPGPSRDHTERMLRARGVELSSQGLCHAVRGPANDLTPLDLTVPGDFSSAAYFLVGALLVEGSEVRLRHVGVNPTRTGLLDALRAMGAEITLLDEREEGGEPVADLLVRSQGLRATTVAGDLVPRMIDEFPILALAATQAEGVTRVRDAAELRVKETDRIATIVEALRALGARIEPRPDGFDVEGPTPLVGAAVDSFGDHRLAMTLAVAGLIARGETTVLRAEWIADSFPGFEPRLQALAPGALS
ncbi:MAG: 3-phosphoshikimate 1-carboxyvinyltransferase [Chloroflexi bacterium]|jgi:3-phosphoshikimate 1-carboxyvinyltransferase|nr:3-phosphoshikimate 1-carboxyvinyltransferase [Chloroflexota bacterium]